jgi:nucleoside transporter
MGDSVPVPWVRTRLSAMMFLQYACGGACIPILTVYMQTQLGFTSRQIGLIFVASSLVALLAPFIQGQIADRHFSTERSIAISHTLAGILACLLAQQRAFYPFLILSILYWLVCNPTIPLTNSMCFRNVPDAKKDFPRIRVWGTIGWIVAGWVYSVIWLEGVSGEGLRAAYAAAIYLSGGISFALAFLCFFLPHTPPKRDALEKNAALAALKLLKKPAFLVLFLISFPAIVEHQFHFFWAGPFLKHIGIEDAWIPRWQSLGQVSEILLILLVPLSLARMGFKFTMGVGLLAYALRFAAFAVGSPTWLVISALTLHGFCFGFFLAVAFIFVDHCAPKDIRASAQALIGITVLGIGPVVANLFAGELGEWTKKPGSETPDYALMYWIVTALGVVTLLLYMVFFKPGELDRQANAEDGPTEALDPQGA